MTYSVVARDPETGQLGVAVQSHYFSVGTVVPWAAPAVGAVATQAMAEISYGPNALERLLGGAPADQALAQLVAADDGRDRRQVAIVDADGRVAVHTGAMCIAEAGHRTGDGWSVQANMMAKPTVWDAMADVMTGSTGDLAERLMAALEAAEDEGGDIRGRQSAALIIVSGDNTAPAWERIFDVRVEDHPEPLVELRRLVEMRRAYLAEEPGPATGANPELSFWVGVHLAGVGEIAAARQALEVAYAVDDGWRELVRRLPPAGLLPDDAELLALLLERGDGSPTD